MRQPPFLRLPPILPHIFIYTVTVARNFLDNFVWLWITRNPMFSDVFTFKNIHTFTGTDIDGKTTIFPTKKSYCRNVKKYIACTKYKILSEFTN